MEFGLDDDHQIFVLKHKDGGALMKVFSEHRIQTMYDYSSGEYMFHNRSDYHAAILLV